MSKFYNHRIFRTFKFEENLDTTINIAGSKKTLQAAYILIKGKITLSTAGVNHAPGGIFNLLKNIQFIVGGVDLVTGINYNAEARINLRGVHLGWCGDTAANYKGNHHMNFLLPHEMLMGDSALGSTEVSPLKNIDISSTDEQEFSMMVELPFYNDNGFSPADFRLNEAFLASADIKIQLGEVSDLGLTGTTVPVGTFKDASVSIILKELQLSDPLRYPGNVDQPQAYMRANYKYFDVNADNPLFRDPLRIAGALDEIITIGFDNSGKPDDSVVQSFGIERENDSFYNLDADMVRYLNQQTFQGAFANTNDTNSFFNGSGTLIHSLTDTANGKNMSQARSLGAGDGTAQWFASLKKSAAGNSGLEVIFKSIIPGANLSLLTKSERDYNANERARAEPIRAAQNARAEAETSVARTLGASV